MLSKILIYLALVVNIKCDYFLMSINSTNGVNRKTIINYDKSTDLYYQVKFSGIINYLVKQNMQLM